MQNAAHYPSPSEMLFTYLDGELDPGDETTLFHYLQTNDDLRVEMRELLNLREHMHRKLLHPSSSVKSTVMQRVGLQSGRASFFPLGFRGGAAGAGGRSFFKGLLPVVTAIVGATLSAVFFVMTAGDKPLPGPRGGIVSASALENSLSEASAPLFFAREGVGAATPTRVGAVRDLDKAVERGSQVVAQEHGSRDKFREAIAHTTQNIVSGPTEIEATQPIYLDDAMFLRNNAMLAAVEAAPVPLEPIPEAYLKSISLSSRPAPIQALSSFAAGLRSFSSRSFPRPVTMPQSAPIFNNMAVSLSMELSGHSSIFVELGQEAFSQKFSGIEDDQAVEYQQNLMLPWVGLGFGQSYNEPIFHASLLPFSRIVAGISEAGPLSRLLLGVRYRIDNLDLHFGIEGAVLAYRFQEQWFASPKLGFSYGLQVKI